MPLIAVPPKKRAAALQMYRDGVEPLHVIARFLGMSEAAFRERRALWKWPPRASLRDHGSGAMPPESLHLPTPPLDGVATDGGAASPFAAIPETPPEPADLAAWLTDAAPALKRAIKGLVDDLADALAPPRDPAKVDRAFKNFTTGVKLATQILDMQGGANADRQPPSGPGGEPPPRSLDELHHELARRVQNLASEGEAG